MLLSRRKGKVRWPLTVPAIFKAGAELSGKLCFNDWLLVLAIME